MKRKGILAILTAALLVTGCASASSASGSAQADSSTAEEKTFNEIVLDTIDTVEDLGGYWTKKSIEGTGFTRNAWEGMDQAFVLDGDVPTIDLSYARPSFCSSACYMVLLKSLLNWDTSHQISKKAWEYLKPYTVDDAAYPKQGDGVGCWGRANANGPGLAVLAAELGAGENLYIGIRSSYETDSEYLDLWEDVKPGDFLKIFWNDQIGYDAASDVGEKGHMVVFLNRTAAYDGDGKRDDIIMYWSSNGTNKTPDKGYSVEVTRMSNIIRAVRTRITDPAAFNNAEKIEPTNVHSWLHEIEESRLGTEEELKQYINTGN